MVASVVMLYYGRMAASSGGGAVAVDPVGGARVPLVVECRVY